MKDISYRQVENAMRELDMRGGSDMLFVDREGYTFDQIKNWDGVDTFMTIWELQDGWVNIAIGNEWHPAMWSTEMRTDGF